MIIIDIQNGTEQIQRRDGEVPREIDFQYVHSVFHSQFQSIDNSTRNALIKTNTIQTIRFLLNEYTRSRLIHYDRLNAFLLNIPSISDICMEAQRKGSLLQILSDEDQIKDFNYRKEELFTPVVAQSALFLLKELLKHPTKTTRVLNEHFPPIRDLLHKFVDKINPHKKENFKWYYHPSNLKNIALFLDKNPDLDITQVFPLFYEDDEFYIEYTDWLEGIQDPTHSKYDERQNYNASVQSDFALNKQNIRLLDDFLHIYLRDAKIPADIDADICSFIPSIIHLDLIREIITFYEKNLPKCFDDDNKEDKQVKGRLVGGIAAFKYVLEQFYGQNFITLGYLEFWNRLSRADVPEQLIDTFILNVEKAPKKANRDSYNVFWKRPFLRIQTSRKNSADQIVFSYVQVLDAFFYFLSSSMKSYSLASSRGRGFEELVAERIIKELGIVPQKIVVHDPAKTDEDEEFRRVMEQNELVTPSGQKIHVCKVVPDLQSPKLRLGENFRWREIDLAFVYDSTMYIIECKNHLFSDFSDFEPIILKRNLLAYSNSYGKRKLCKDERVRHSLNIMGQMRYKQVRFMIVTGEECPFEFMLSYTQFGNVLRDFELIHKKLEEVDKSFVSKTELYEEFEPSKKYWFEDMEQDLVQKKLQSGKPLKKQWMPMCYDVLKPLEELGALKISTVHSSAFGSSLSRSSSNSTSSSSKHTISSSSSSRRINTDGLTKLLSEKIALNLKKGFQMDASHFEQFFLSNNPELKLAIGIITRDPVKLRNFLLTVFHTSLKYKDFEENPFSIPAWSLKYCLHVVEIYFGAKERQKFKNVLHGSIVRMFKNIVVGGKGAGRYYKVDSVKNLKKLRSSFDEAFSRYGIKSPSLKAIKVEVKKYISGKSYPVIKMDRILALLGDI